MQNQKPRLSNAAISAGIFLLLTAVAYGLCRVIHPMLTDRLLYFTAGLLAVIAIMLFTRRRNMAYGVLFLVLMCLSVAGAVLWGQLNMDLPYFFAYAARALCFLGMMIVCFRRGRQPKKGPWFLAVIPLLITIAFLVITLITREQRHWMDAIGFMSIYLLVTEVLLFIGALLTAVAFRSSQPEAASSNTLSGADSGTPSGQTVYTGYAQAEDPGSQGRSQAGYSQKAAASSAAEPAAPEPAAAEPVSVESAEIEWLDEEE